MSEVNLRQKAVKSLMLAIDLENGDRDLEAYLKYLEGLSLVVTALQKDVTSGDEWLFTDKVRRSMVNFAKESIDRIILLLKKQDRIAEKSHEEVVPTILKASYSDLAINSPKKEEKASHSFSRENNVSKQEEAGSHPCNEAVVNYPNLLDSYNALEENILGVDPPLSPLDAVRQENSQLSKKYAQRLLNVSPSQQPQLRLELERRIAENKAIAESRQLVWEAKRAKAAVYFHQIAEQKCRQKQKTKEKSQEDDDSSTVEVIYSCLMFEWERKLRAINDALEVNPQSAEVSNPELIRSVMKKSMDMATRALRGSIRGHPLGSLLVKKQQSVCSEVNSILCSQDVHESSSKEVHVFFDNNVNEGSGPIRMFNKIAEGIKKDMEFLENIILSLYEPLNTEEGQLLLSQTLQKIYFPAITPSLKALLRCVHSPKTDSGKYKEKFNRNSEDEEKNIGVDSSHSIQNSSEIEARFRLQSLQSLSSPYEKLDCLTEVMRSLCSWKFDSPEDVKKGNLQPIGADDLLSRLVAVIHSGHDEGEGSLAHILQMEAVFLEAFLPDGMVLGEAGYSVTVLCSALSV